MIITAASVDNGYSETLNIQAHDRRGSLKKQASQGGGPGTGREGKEKRDRRPTNRPKPTARGRAGEGGGDGMER